MSDQLLFAPLRALDSNGDPVAGAKARFYESGTTNLITVYADQALTTPHDDPLLANASGVFAPAFYGNAATAKVDVTDADDVSLPGYPIEIVARGSGGGGASIVNFSPIAGNTATNVQDAIENNTNTLVGFGTQGAAGKAVFISETTTAARTALELGGAALVDVVDEDDMATNSATRPPSQQSVAAYVQAEIAARRYTSGEQTITTGGLLTLAHGLAAAPRMVSYRLRCTSSDAGYAVNDEIIVDLNSTTTTTVRTSTARVDGTNIYIRFSSAASVFTAGNKGTGAGTALNNASWKLRVEALL